MDRLKDQIAVITGASQGIGHAIAVEFARQGATIVNVDINLPDKAADDIESHGVKYYGVRYDLCNIDGIGSLVDEIVAKAGTIDILINNAGAQKRHPCAEFPRHDWDLVMTINCTAVFFLCQQVGRVMLAKGRGKIINLASLLSFQGGLNVPAYAASKGAVMQFSKSLANEWAEKGININCIAPGYLDTEMNVALVNDPERSRQIMERIPAGRWGLPADIAGTALFLASSDSDYVNGITIPVDGGWLGR